VLTLASPAAGGGPVWPGREAALLRVAVNEPAGAATDSALDTPPDGQPSPSAAAPPGGPAGPGRRDHPHGRRARAGRPGKGRPRYPGPDRVPAAWTAWDVPDEAPGPAGPDSLAVPHSSSIAAAGIATQDTQEQDAGDLGPEKEDAGSAAPADPADPAGTAPGAEEALGAAAVTAAQAEAALQAGDLEGALAAADHLAQAAARTRWLLRHSGRAARRGLRRRRPLHVAAQRHPLHVPDAIGSPANEIAVK
jgi:hypothetical protein